MGVKSFRVMPPDPPPSRGGVGRVFSETRPKIGVITHVVTLTDGTIPPLSPKQMTVRVRSRYDGPLALGEDQMTIVLEGGEVAVPSAADAMKESR